MKSHFRVLLIEKDDDEYLLVKKLLSEISSVQIALDRAATCESGLEAIGRSEHDVVLLDYSPGTRAGGDLLREVAAKHCSIPVILLAGSDCGGIDFGALEPGVSDILDKGRLTADLLEHSIRCSIQKRRSELEIVKYRDHLEELVAERTAELVENNRRLEKSNRELLIEIAEKARTEGALCESEREYRELVENSLDLIYAVNSDGTICSLNPAFESITGWPSEEWLGKKFFSLIHPDDLASLRKRFKEVLKGRTQTGNEVRVLTRSGAYRVLELMTVPRVRNGKLVGVLGNARDVTDRKQAEEKLREQKDFLSSVLESLGHPFFVISADDYTIKMANSAATPEVLPPGITCFELTHGKDVPCGESEHYCPIETIKRTGRPLTTEHVHYDKMGNSRSVEVHGYPVFDRNGRVVQIIEYFFDITERKTIEDELRTTRDDLAKERSLLHSVLTQLPAGIIVAEQSGRIILMNDRSTAILGFPKESASHISEFSDYPCFHPDGRVYEHGEYPLMRSLEKGEIVTDEELKLRTPDGVTKIILANSSPIRDSVGNIVAAFVIFQDVTDRKRAEEELHRREQEYRALVENSPDVVMRVDRELRRIFANQALAKTTGYPLPSFIGSTIYEPPREERREYVTRMEKACRKVLQSGEEVAVDFPYPTTRGLRHFHMRIVPEYSKEGKIETLLTISRDVTELRQMQEDLLRAKEELESRVLERTAELRKTNEALQAEILERKRILEDFQQSEARYKELVQNANSIILRMDAKGRVTFFNEFAQSFFGYSEDEILGQNIVGTIVPRTESTGRDLVAMIRGIIENPVEYIRNENENIRKNGERVWVYWTNKALVDKNGHIVGVLCIGNDMTERKKAEEALKLDEIRLQALWELSRMSDASLEQICDFVLEKQVKVTKSKLGWLGFMNEDETVLTLHASSRETVEKCAVAADKSVHFPLQSAGIWADAVRERKTIIVNDYSAPHPHKRGLPEGHSCLARFMVSPILDGSRIVAVAAVANKDQDYDAADMRQHALLLDGIWQLIQRERTAKSLREAESLAAIGRALASVAHDLKTPLVAIGGFSRLVRGHLAEDNPDRGKLDIVLDETDRLEKMVRDMLDFSRPLVLEKMQVHLEDVIRESLTIVEAIARGKKVSVSCRLSSDLPGLSIDPLRFRQALINVLMNAVQASPEEGAVVVRTGRKGLFVLVDVSDQGPGIPPEKRKEVFYPFVTTKKGGTGLGLPIIKKIMEAHRGKVEIFDSSDMGTTFRLSLPVESG